MPSFLEKAASPIAGGLGLIQSFITNRFQKKRDERQFQHSKEMSELAYNRDLEQWERANEYNAPTQQMARLREAGLSPQLVYGSKGAGNAGQAATLPKYQAARPEYKYGSPVNFMQALGAYQSIQKHNVEMDIARSVAKKEANEALHSGRYFGNRGWLQSEKRSQAEMYSSYMSGETNLAERVANGEASQWEIEQFRKLQNMEKRNTLLDKQIEFWLANNLGGALINALGKFIPLVRGKKALRGVKLR